MKALVVDDDQLVRTMLGTVLRTRFLCRVVEARDGREALELIRSESPDVVFLDVTMPEMDGVETLTAIRADPASAALPVIVLSGADSLETARKMVSLGVSDYLVKPLRPDALVKRAGVLLSRVGAVKA